MPPPSNLPSPLLRFPAEVRTAYERFCATGDPAALEIVVQAAVRDFMPRGGTADHDQPLQADLRLVDDLGFDSLALAETVFFFEDLFKVSIDNRDLLGLRTIGELQGFIARRNNEERPPA